MQISSRDWIILILATIASQVAWFIICLPFLFIVALGHHPQGYTEGLQDHLLRYVMITLFSVGFPSVAMYILHWQGSKLGYSSKKGLTFLGGVLGGLACILIAVLTETLSDLPRDINTKFRDNLFRIWIPSISIGSLVGYGVGVTKKS